MPWCALLRRCALAAALALPGAAHPISLPQLLRLPLEELLRLEIADAVPVTRLRAGPVWRWPVANVRSAA